MRRRRYGLDHRYLAGGEPGVLPVPVAPPRSEVENRPPSESADENLVRIGIDANLVRIAFAHDHISAGRAAVVDEAVAGLLSGGKAHVVPGLHLIRTSAKARREGSFENENVLLLEDMV